MIEDTFYDSVSLHRVRLGDFATVYRHSGRDWQDAESIVFVHGSLVSGRWWEPALAAFQELMPNKYACYAPDLRSHGDADTPSLVTGTDFVGDLLALLDQIGLRQAHLVGWAMGGEVATRFALAHPERCLSLVLVSSLSPYATTELGSQATREFLAQATERGEFEAVARIIRANSLRDGRFPLDNSPPGNALFYYLLQSVMNVHYFPPEEPGPSSLRLSDLTERHTDLTLPVLSVHGNADASIPPEYWETARRAWANHRFEETIFEGGGHSPPIEGPRRFAITLDEFFSTL